LGDRWVFSVNYVAYSPRFLRPQLVRTLGFANLLLYLLKAISMPASIAPTKTRSTASHANPSKAAGTLARKATPEPAITGSSTATDKRVPKILTVPMSSFLKSFLDLLHRLNMIVNKPLVRIIYL